MSAGNSTWSDVVAAKREERETRLGKYKLADSNSPDSADLISAGLVDIEAITALLLSKQQSAEDLTRAFIQR